MKRTRPLVFDFRRTPGASRTGTALLLLGALMATAGITGYASLSTEVERVEGQLAEMKRMMRRAPGEVAETPRDAREVQQEVRMANTVIRQMTIPWDQLFRELESAGAEDVALLAVQPDVGSRQLRIDGEAKTLKAMLDYSRRLESTPMLSRVVVLGHEVKAQQPQRPVGFAVSAGWSETR